MKEYAKATAELNIIHNYELSSKEEQVEAYIRFEKAVGGVDTLLNRLGVKQGHGVQEN